MEWVFNIFTNPLMVDFSLQINKRRTVLKGLC